jgi:hypothetical protein
MLRLFRDLELRLANRRVYEKRGPDLASQEYIMGDWNLRDSRIALVEFLLSEHQKRDKPLCPCES